MVLVGSGRYWLEVVDTKGKKRVDRQKKPITVIPDEPPVVTWRFPKEGTEVDGESRTRSSPFRPTFMRLRFDESRLWRAFGRRGARGHG